MFEGTHKFWAPKRLRCLPMFPVAQRCPFLFLFHLYFVGAEEIHQRIKPDFPCSCRRQTEPPNNQTNLFYIFEGTSFAKETTVAPFWSPPRYDRTLCSQLPRGACSFFGGGISFHLFLRHFVVPPQKMGAKRIPRLPSGRRIPPRPGVVEPPAAVSALVAELRLPRLSWAEAEREIEGRREEWRG